MFGKDDIAFANPLRNRPWIVEAWAHGLGAGVHDVHGNDRQLVRAAIAGVQEDARMASRVIFLAVLREIREHAAVRHVVPVDGNEERPFRAVGVALLKAFCILGEGYAHGKSVLQASTCQLIKQLAKLVKRS